MYLSRIAAAAMVSVLACGAGVAAQSGTTERKEKTKIEIKGGKDVTVNGCLERSDGTTDYALVDPVGQLKYAVVTDDDLSKYVGKHVRVKGRAADEGDAKVKITHKVEGTSGESREAKIETKGDTVLPYLGLKSIKSIAGSCD